MTYEQYMNDLNMDPDPDLENGFCPFTRSACMGEYCAIHTGRKCGVIDKHIEISLEKGEKDAEG